MSSFCSSNFHFVFFSLVCYSNICNRLSETNAPEHRVQTSLKRCGLKFSLRQDMSAKFPRGGGGSRTFFSSKSRFTRTSLLATVTRVSNFVEENMCVCAVFLHRQGSPSRWIQSLNAQNNRLKYVNRNALSMFKALNKSFK